MNSVTSKSVNEDILQEFSKQVYLEMNSGNDVCVTSNVWTCGRIDALEIRTEIK